MVMFWVAALAISLLLYAILGGAVLGVGMLLGFTPNEKSRQLMLDAIAPVRGSTDVWLISAGVVLWAAFPIAYAILYSAFCVPALLMFAGLILRAAASDLRDSAKRARWIWDAVVCGGSLIAAFMQGMIVGVLVEALPVAGGHYMGGAFGWLSPFALLCGVGQCVGYSLLGACWIFQKCEGAVGEHARQMLPNLAGGLFAFFVFLFFYALVDLEVMSRWLERPYLLVIPAMGVVTAFLLAVTVRHERRRLPLYMAAAIFVAGFGTLAASFWPFMVPFAVTIDAAAAPLSKLAFILWAGANVLSLILAYAATNRTTFDVGLFPHPPEQPCLSVTRHRREEK